MRLTEQQVVRYFKEGFLIVEDVLTMDDMLPVMDEFEALVDGWAERFYEKGEIADKHLGEDLYTRLASLEKERPGTAPVICSCARVGPALARLWSSDKIVDMIEQFIGPNVFGHPVANIRTKTPDTSLLTVPWHQDCAYLLEGEEDALVPAAWIPFLDTNLENGTLQVIRGGHRTGTVCPHHLERDVANPKSWYLYIKDEDLPDGEIVPCEAKMGSVVLFGQMLPHRSTENTSDKVRWSVDFRYQGPGKAVGMPAGTAIVPIRRGDDPDYRLDWEAWKAEQPADVQAYNRPEEDNIDYLSEGPWLERWAT